MRNWLIILAVLIFSEIGFTKTNQKELIGTLGLSELLLQPKFYAIEGGEQKFDLERSYFFFSWKLNNQLAVHFGVGQYALINPNERMSSNLALTGLYDELRFFEAYAEWDSGYGTIRAGLIPLFLGWEGVHKESEWKFPRTLFYENHDYGLRDMGASYFVDSHGFYVQFAVHNGENGKDVDGKLWHSARWGWKNDSGVDVSLAASNGRYMKSKLDPLNTFTYLNSYASFEFYDLLILAEGFYGKQEESATPAIDTKFWDYHVDLSHPIAETVSALIRYEKYEPDSNVEGDQTTRWIAGFSLSNELRTSTVYLWAIKNSEESAETNNNEIQIVWKIRSLSIF